MEIYVGVLLLFVEGIQTYDKILTCFLVLEVKLSIQQKLFFWLVLQDRLNTKDMLKRRDMKLERCMCKNCILQKEETMSHLFLKGNFAKWCWQAIRIAPQRTTNPHVAT
jgi:hypothetical protein